jgi:TolB protein
MRKLVPFIEASLRAPLRRDRRALLAAVTGSALACALPRAAGAQMRIDVSGVGATQYPIAIASFINEGKVPVDVVDVLRADLTRSGAFRLIDPLATLSRHGPPPTSPT